MLRSLAMLWSVLAPAVTDDPRAPQSPVTAVVDPARARAAAGVGPRVPKEEQAELEARNDAPTMPAVEEISRPSSAEQPRKRSLFDLGPEDRGPAGEAGGSFFDPGKLDATGPSGGLVQVRGYASFNFFVTERSRVTADARTPDGYEALDPLPFFGGSVATLYVGAPVYSDIVYARIALEYLAIPKVTASSGQADILTPATRVLLMESAAIEINPFAWAKAAPRWFSEGFKFTGGVFIVPFGLEDLDHAAPVNWFVSRTRSFTVGHVYPGTWSDIGLYVTWKPTFGRAETGRFVRPIELDLGFVNGDPCTQTRFADTLYQPTSVAAVCESLLRPGEVESVGMGPVSLPADVGFLGVGPDNNANKSVLARVQVFPVAAWNVGASLVWGKHPRALDPREKADGLSTPDVPQAPSWRVGVHMDLDLDAMFESKFPLPQLRGEWVYGEDRAATPFEVDAPSVTDRRLTGGYAQVSQALFRRKRTRLPGLILQYRFDHSDPDLSIPGRRNGIDVDVDFHDAQYLYDEAMQTHTIGLRFPVLPRFTLKTDFSFLLEEGGRANQLRNNLFGIQAVADF